MNKTERAIILLDGAINVDHCAIMMFYRAIIQKLAQRCKITER
jgi:hypothetical protein